MRRKKIKFSPKLQSSSLDDIKKFVRKDALNTPVISDYNTLPASYKNGGETDPTVGEGGTPNPIISSGQNVEALQRVLNNIYPEIFTSLNQTSQIKDLKAIGIIETLTAPSIFVAADAAVKATSVDLVEIRIARALGGKNICIINGEVSSVSESVRVGIQYAEEKGFLVDSQVIASPHKDLYRAIM